MEKTLDDYFYDWEKEVFGFGYGTGEIHTIQSLKSFMSCIKDGCNYDYTVIEKELGSQVCWLLINTLCNHNADILDYGISPRYGFLTDKGKRLKKYMDSKTIEELYDICMNPQDDYIQCARNYCNCDEGGIICPSPFFVDNFPRKSKEHPE
jgi:hypothetical protein